MLFRTLAVLLLPAIAVAQPLSEITQDFYKIDPTVIAAREEYRAAKNQVRSAQGALLPNIVGSASWFDQNVDVEGTGDIDSTPREYAVRASQPIFQGELIGAVGAAKAAEDLYRAGYHNVYQQQVVALANAYLSVLKNEEILALQDAQIELLQGEKRAANIRFEVGDSSKTDVAQAQARLAEAEATRASAQGNLLAARAQLKALLGELPTSLEWPELPEMRNVALSDLEAQALLESPSVLQADATVKAEAAGLNIARAAWLPDVTASANYSKTKGALFVGSATESETTSWGITAELPLFEGGQRIFDQRAAARNKASAKQLRLAAQRASTADVTSAYYQLQAAHLSVKAFADAVEANELAAQGVRREQELGSRSTLDLLDAERELLNSKVNLSTAKASLIVANMQLDAAIGALLPPDLAQ